MKVNFKVKEGTHFVIKKGDAIQYLHCLQEEALSNILETIKQGRKAHGRKENQYLIINTDEPYADEIREVIKRGELAKGELK